MATVVRLLPVTRQPLSEAQELPIPPLIIHHSSLLPASRPLAVTLPRPRRAAVRGLMTRPSAAYGCSGETLRGTGLGGAKRFGGTTNRAGEDFGKRRRGLTEGAEVASGMCKATLNASGTEARLAQWSTYPSAAPQEAARCPKRASVPAVVKAPPPFARRYSWCCRARGGRRYGAGSRRGLPQHQPDF